MQLFKFLYPNAYYKRVYDIPLDLLEKKGIKGLVFDLDNTLAPFYSPEPDEETIAFIKNACDKGFSVCILSNNSEQRVSLYNKKLDILTVSRANKPMRRGLRRAMVLMGTQKESTVIIGDQIFTDVWCGKRTGIRAILVAPCSQKDEWITKIKRGMEKIVVNEYLKAKKTRKIKDSE